MNTPIATRTDIPTPDQVEVWLTLGDASKKLSQEPSLTFVPAPTPDSPVIKIDSETRDLLEDIYQNSGHELLPNYKDCV